MVFLFLQCWFLPLLHTLLHKFILCHFTFCFTLEWQTCLFFNVIMTSLNNFPICPLTYVCCVLAPEAPQTSTSSCTPAIKAGLNSIKCHLTDEWRTCEKWQKLSCNSEKCNNHKTFIVLDVFTSRSLVIQQLIAVLPLPPELSTIHPFVSTKIITKGKVEMIRLANTTPFVFLKIRHVT